MNKILSSGFVVSALMLLVGCGAVDDLVDKYTDEDDVSTGTAYYIDSAVGGVNYTCGSQEGTTGTDGAFTFEVGSSCTFYLGDMELRSVATEALVDGKAVVETDLVIARILQSLDSDGDTSNGITIDAAIITAIAEAGITSLPDTVDELAVLLEVIVDNGGTIVSEEDAQAHLDETTLKFLLAGKTLYVGVYGEMATLESWTFSADLTSAAWQEIVSQGETLYNGTGELSVSGMTMTYTCTNDSGDSCNPDPVVMTVTEILEDYMLVSIVDGDYTSVDRLYFDEAKARDYYLEEMIITEEMLTAQPFYDEDFDDTGYSYSKMTFTATTGTRHEIWYNNNDDSVREDGTFSFPITIVDGKVRADVTQFGEGYMWFTLVSISDIPSWELIKEDDEDMDGNIDIDSSGKAEWYLSKPDYFPASL